MNENASTFRERAGVFAGLFLIMCFGASGLAIAVASAAFGVELKFDATWMSSMVVLVGTAAGFLFGKQTSNPAAPPPRAADQPT